MKMTFQRAGGEPTEMPVTVNTQPAPSRFSWSILTWPKRLPTPDRHGETMRATENLWRRDTERLAYAANELVPVDELAALIGESDLMALHRAGKRACDA